MPIAHEEIRDVLRHFHPNEETNLIAADYYRKLAIVTYAKAIRRSPYRETTENERAFEAAYEFYEKALILGLSEERVEVPFFNLRRNWIPRLPEIAEQAKKQAQKEKRKQHYIFRRLMKK